MSIFGELVMNIDGVERSAFPWADWAMTTHIDTRAYWQRVWQAVRCHRSQVPGEKDLQHLTEDIHLFLWGSQEYYRVYSLVNAGRTREQDLLQFPFVDALFGCRSRRFFRMAEIPDGPLTYKSKHEPIPFAELEKLLILTSVGGNTGCSEVSGPDFQCHLAG